MGPVRPVRLRLDALHRALDRHESLRGIRFTESGHRALESRPITLGEEDMLLLARLVAEHMESGTIVMGLVDHLGDHLGLEIGPKVVRRLRAEVIYKPDRVLCRID